MRFIPTQIHGMLDYLVSILLIAAPWLLGFAEAESARWVPVVLGVGAILYSLITRYEFGITGIISMPVHLWLDGLSGLLLSASPWLFGFADVVWLPHLLFGLLEIGVALTTHTAPKNSLTSISA